MITATFSFRGDSKGKEGSTPERDPRGQPGAWYQHLPEEDKQRSWESREERRTKQWPSGQMLKAQVPGAGGVDSRGGLTHVHSQPQ